MASKFIKNITVVLETKEIINTFIGVKKKNYDDKKCNNQLKSVALDLSKLFENIEQSRKESYKITYNPRKIFYAADPLGKSEATYISFTFLAASAPSEHQAAFLIISLPKIALSLAGSSGDSIKSISRFYFFGYGISS